ncbi:unnamed protein product [Soboliphyme baturini]|uniref:PPM-type phosphatase domain-containing protein n=1 Tax=Soboliphyme baturini TaxID=241478 RepID=A0A183II78_9BILA|nr:unnamed protein product [Soboliphyme baturini]
MQRYMPGVFCRTNDLQQHPAPTNRHLIEIYVRHLMEISAHGGHTTDDAKRLENFPPPYYRLSSCGVRGSDRIGLIWLRKAAFDDPSRCRTKLLAGGGNALVFAESFASFLSDFFSLSTADYAVDGRQSFFSLKAVRAEEVSQYADAMMVVSAPEGWRIVSVPAHGIRGCAMDDEERSKDKLLQTRQSEGSQKRTCLIEDDIEGRRCSPVSKAHTSRSVVRTVARHSSDAIDQPIVFVVLPHSSKQ